MHTLEAFAKTGPLKAEELADVLNVHPRTARRLLRRLV
jgi:predicted ArsR family transcriptional regulator